MKRWRYMVWGGIGAGKTSLIRALQGGPAVTKTQMIEYLGDAIDTPGEYSVSQRMARYLLATSADAQLFVVVQDATQDSSQISPNYFQMCSQPVLGVVTKVDLPGANVERAEAILHRVGVTGEIYRVSIVTGEGLNDLKQTLEERSKKWRISMEAEMAKRSV